MKKVVSALITLGVLAAAPALVSAAPAGPIAVKQHVVIEAKKTAGPGGGTFVVTSMGSGPLISDFGNFTFTVSQKHVVRSGQPATIYTVVSTWAGKQGTMVFRERIEDVAAENGYRVGTGVWSLIAARGTGQYAGLNGTGRSAYAWTNQNRVYFRFEGTVTKP